MERLFMKIGHWINDTVSYENAKNLFFVALGGLFGSLIISFELANATVTLSILSTIMAVGTLFMMEEKADER